ncbi:unnamed protein product [uncultured bacterium]|nr:unnamed protein product [uncultured bacterium]
MPRPPFAEAIRAERARLGWTQAFAAARLGTTRGTYRQLEETTADPRLSTLVALVGAGFRLGVIAPGLTTQRGG